MRSSSNSARASGGGCLFLFGLAFILAGLAVAWFAYIPGVWGWWQAQSWVEVPCWIEEVSLKENHDSDDGTTTYSTQAAYRYEYDRRSFRGDRVALVGGSDNMGDFQQRVHDELSHYAGKEEPFRCLVNPANPEESVLYAELRWGMMLMLSLFPLLFPLAGGLIGIGGLVTARIAARKAALRASHPDEPWRWLPEWAGERITASTGGLTSLMVATLWLMAVELPLVAAIVVSGALQESWLAWMSFLMLLPLWSLLRAVWRRLRMRAVTGRVSLHVPQLPLKPGRQMVGRLHFSKMLPPGCGLEARMRCVRQTTRGDSTVKETLWEQVEMLATDEQQIEPAGGCSLPVRMDLPSEVPGMDLLALAGDQSRASQCDWSLEVHAGSSTKAVVIPLPVFEDGNDASDDGEKAIAKAEALSERVPQLESRLASCSIRAEFESTGEPVFIECPPGRNRAPALFLICFGGAWMCIFIVLMARNAPLLFKLIWGITAPAIELYGLWLLLHRSRVDVVDDALRISNHVGSFYGRMMILSRADIVEFTSQETMRSGQTTYHSVRAETTIRQKHTLVSGITEEATARELVRRFDLWKKGR